MSDNGRTFVGVKNHLDLSEPSIASFAAEKSISWKFIPPRTPHQGGIWKAAVKAAKHHLNRVVNGKILSFEEYGTVFCQIEGILNSRPLAYHREPDKSVVMITPAHLAIGRPLLQSVRNLPEDCSSMGTRYNLTRDIVNSFWLSWRKEYLSTLQWKSKWHCEQNNPNEGDVVLLVDDNAIPSEWKMAVVVAVYPDKLGQVRAVDVRTSNGQAYRRTTTKLVQLLN